MNAPTTVLPEPVATDPTEVADALDVARSLCEKGSLDDALRWLRRAVEAASETAEAPRVAALAHAAADLAELASKASAPIAPIAPTSQIRLASRTTMKPSSLPPASVAPPPPPPRPSIRVETRLRVSVRTSVRDPELMVVRPLKDHQPLPRGTREAFLVMAEASGAEETADGDLGELTDQDVIAVTGSSDQ